MFAVLTGVLVVSVGVIGVLRAPEYTIDVGQFTTGEFVKGVGHIIEYDSGSNSYLLYINPSQDFIKIA